MDFYFVRFSMLMDYPANLRETETEGEQALGEIKGVGEHML